MRTKKRLRKPPAAYPRDWRDLIWIYNRLDEVASQVEYYVANEAGLGEDQRSFLIHSMLADVTDRALKFRRRVARRRSPAMTRREFERVGLRAVPDRP